MKTAAFCIRHRVTTIMVYIMAVIFGIMGFTSLPLALMPDIELPMAIIMTTYAGAGPEEIENLVTKPIENACASVAGMEELQSQSSENSSIVMVTFSDGTDLDEALTDLRDKIDQAKSMLPDDASAPTVMKMDVSSMPVVMIGLRGADLAQLQQIADDDITPALERIDGVASVTVSGGYDNEVSIQTHADQMSGYGLSISYISQILAAQNIAIPAGDVDNGSQSLSVRTTGEFQSVDDIADLLIPLPTGGSVRLGEVADVSMQPTDQDAIAKIDGEPCVIITVQQQSDSNTVDVANRVKAQLDTITEENPTLDWSILMDQSDYINLSVDSVVQNIVLGVVLAALVLLVFLRDLGATTVIAISMPVCIISVFLVMNALDITMNMMSLGGLAMGVGMIVDNSIVVLENIFRYRSDGFSRWDSCTKGTAEVSLSITAGTLTTVAVFLPIGLSGGLAGMMFKEFSITISSLLFASLFIALTLVPLLCYILLDRGKEKRRLTGNQGDIADRPLLRGYKKLLRLFITQRKIAVLVSLALLVVFGMSIGLAGFELMPATDEGQISVSLEMPVGAELEETAEIADRVTDIAVETIPELESIYYTTGGTSIMGGGTSLTIDVGSKKDRERGVEEIANTLRDDLADIAGCELTVEATSTTSMGTSSGSAVSVSLRGNDYDALTEAGDRLVQEIEALPDAIDVKSSASDQVPQVDITLKHTNATRYGLNASTIGAAVRSELDGSTATKLKVDGEEINVSVKGDSRSSTSLDALRAVLIPTNSGGSVPLSVVADVQVVQAPQQISRDNQSRTITVTAGTKSDDVVAFDQQVQDILADFDLPDGVDVETGGEMADMAESFGSLGQALVVGLGLIYFILASQFESFIMPVIVMMILPIGLIGSLFGLPMTGQKISIVAFIGVIMLAGTVVNSSIVLVDYINTRRKRGEDKNTAILNACPRRIRPVLMTTLTTILGLLPMAFAQGEGSEMMAPMAVVMITGMVVSTIVTLFFTPVYYSLIDSISERFKNRKRRRGGKNGDPGDEEPEPPLELETKEEGVHV